MGVGSAAFEARFANVLAKLRHAGEMAGVVDGTYVHDVLGIGFALPESWSARDICEVERVAEGRLLNSYDEVFNEVSRSLTASYLPIVVVAAPDLDDPVARLGPHEVTPVITLHLEDTVAASEVATFDLLYHVATDLAHFHARVEDYRLMSGPDHAKISGCDAVSYVATYMMQHADAVGGCPFRERACYFLHGAGIYALRMCDFPELDPRLTFNYNTFVAGVCIR
ncbi:MAG: hypothetical protein M3P51_18745 [Chloroflexota bacterium]|nr:hypothetical protein [Chloroflexota bacterium]